ncbi:OmpA family protein [Vibrio sp. YIC-376]|uniref:OmpA family protein n=1 Tax=Vibrio sp. YIC-376 TaxID=3136162 RepID=UPI00402AA6FD
MSKCFLWLAFFWVCSIGKAFSIEIPMDLVRWTYSGNHFECKLEYYIPQHGKFYFRSNKKNELLFNIELKKYSESWNEGTLFSQSAPWQKELEQKLISDSAVIDDKNISFSHNIEILLNATSSGSWLKVMLSGSNTSASLEYVVPTIHFQEGVSKFKQCKDKLPEISFSEARDAFIYFESGQRIITASQRKHIHALHSYVIVDSHINKILIDGYTDSTGDAVSNLKISRQRAELVADELKKLGVSENQIEVRAHGSRYPIKSNTTKAGRAKNRRVTIRLVRDNEKVIPAKK